MNTVHNYTECSTIKMCCSLMSDRAYVYVYVCVFVCVVDAWARHVLHYEQYLVVEIQKKFNKIEHL